jgi:hypothetical protein
MYGRSYGNVRELIVSGGKEAVQGQTGYKSPRLILRLREERGPAKGGETNREQPASTATVKEDQTEREGQ